MSGSFRCVRRMAGVAGLAGAVLMSVACAGAADEGDRAEALAAEQLSRCVVYLENDANGAYITGTLLYPDGTTIVTNYHVLSASTDPVHVYLNTADNGVERFACTFLKGDPQRDIAVFRLSFGGKNRPQLSAEGFAEDNSGSVTLPYTNRYLTAGLFASPEEIRRGYRVAFLGFPLSYGMPVEGRTKRVVKSPVYRTGTVASEAFNGEFLIDAMVSNGNSGSPVFVRSGRGRRYAFVGIIKEFQRDTIRVKMDDGKTADVPHNAGLGVVIPVGVIEVFLREAGL